MKRWAAGVLGVIGLALLVSLVAELGPARIGAEMRGLGNILPLVLLLTGLKYVLQATGWRTVLPAAMRPAWGDSISATITGDALGYLTWAGPFTGEPIRALLIRHKVPISAGIAAGAAERTMYNVTAAALIAIVMSVVGGWRVAAWVAGACVVVIVIAEAVRRGGNREARVRTQEPSKGFARKLARALDVLRPLTSDRRGVLLLLAGLCAAQHALLVVESYAMLTVLGAGPSPGTALVFEAVTKLVNTVGVVVPGRLGIAEWGSALVAASLGFSASYGLSLALMRRIRALLWAAVGLCLLPITERRARMLSQNPVP